MADFSFVLPRLATGAAISNKDDVDQLAAAGITHIIDCRGEYDDLPLLSSHPNILYTFNGVADDGAPKPSRWFRKSLEFALPALALPKNKVYCHCAAGINRGPSTCYAIMRALGFPADYARATIVSKRPVTAGGIAYAKDADQAVFVLGYE